MERRVKKELPKTLAEIEFIPFEKRDIDTNIKGKPSVYLRNVLIPYYRRLIAVRDMEIIELKKSKVNLMKRKNEQINKKKWLKYKSNQKRYAVQQRKVREQSVDLTVKKVKRSAFEKGDLLSSIYFLPVYHKIAKEAGLKFNELIYLVYTSNFKFLSLADYREFFCSSYSLTAINNCKDAGYLDYHKTSVNQYFLSLKGRELIKKIKKEVEEQKTDE